MSLNKILKKISYISNTHLREGVEYISINGNTKYFRDSTLNTYAFIIVNDKVIISEKNKTHGDAVIKQFNLINNGVVNYEKFDKIYNNAYYSGRVWLDFNRISFWNSYVPEVIVYDVKNTFKTKFPNEDFNNYYIEYGKK
jgi:hypothetical protein